MKMVYAFLLVLFAVSCSTNKALRCSKGKSNRKAKTYSVKQKKVKRVYSAYSSSSSKKDKPKQKAALIKVPSTVRSLQSVQSKMQLNNQPVSIKVDSVSNNQTETSPQKQRIISKIPSTNKQSKTLNFEPRTINQPKIDKSAQGVENPEQVTNRQEQTTENQVPPNQADSLAFIDYQLRTNKMVRLDDKLFKVEEEIDYEHRLEFVPNYFIFTNPVVAEKEISELVKFLKKFPSKRITVYGNGGLEVDEKEFKGDIHYQYNPRTNERVKVYYGSNHLVYEQVLYNLINEEKEQLKRIEEENLSKVTSAQVGLLLYERARAVKKLLIAQGVDKKRIKALRGEYTPYANHTIRIKIK